MKNILLSLLVLVISTLIYSTQQNIPTKVIGHPITTLFASGILGLLGAFIFKKIKKPEKTLFQLFSYSFMMIVICLSIAKNAGIYMANKKVNEFVNDKPSETISQSKVYRNTDYGVSFKYPPNWELKTPQRAATLVLLYELNGSEATCNLSVAEQDMQSISDYNVNYFQTHLKKVLSGVENVSSQEELVNGKNVSITNYDFTLPTENGEITGSSLTITSLHKGKRFMLIINAPKDKL